MTQTPHNAATPPLAQRDGNGLTEAEFLAQYQPGAWPQPSVTADIVVLGVSLESQELAVLLIQRGGHPFLGSWALPGGFGSPNESLDDTAARELFEETGIAKLPLEQLATFSTPGRDPRGWTVTGAYLAVVERSQLKPRAGDDAAAVSWFAVQWHPTARAERNEEHDTERAWELAGLSRAELAFDHEHIIDCALRRFFDSAPAQTGEREAFDPEDRRVLYRTIEQEYLAGLETQGLVFAKREDATDASHKAAALKRLAGRGALVRNRGASVSLNNLSSACVACTGGAGSKTFVLSLQCNRSCYFCFNPNQADYAEHSAHLANWQAQLEQLGARPAPVTHIALTGGEPLLHRAETLHFFETVHERYPNIHTRLYTAGDLLDESTLARLAQAGLTEIRFSIKLDDPPALRKTVLELVACARQYIPQVMVEMPVIPGTQREMQELLVQLDELDIFGINLLEFCYPRHNWSEFAQRSFALKNPPFAVLYDYGYAGGLPVAGSEPLALELLEFALDQKLTLGVHYCSLENKHRDEVYQANTPYANALPYHELDAEDFFLKSIVAFDTDAAALRNRAKRLGVPFEEDAEDGSLQCKPSDLAKLIGQNADAEGLTAQLYTSYNIIEQREGEAVLRELKLEPLDGERDLRSGRAREREGRQTV